MTEVASGDRLRVVIPEQGDRRGPHHRLTQLFDPGSFVPFPGAGAGAAAASSRVLAGRGRIDGDMAVAFCTDGTRMGGALGAGGAADRRPDAARSGDLTRARKA